MLRHERHRHILAYLTEHDAMSVETAVLLLKTSPATVRRDFNDLARQHLAVRTHGGIGTARISTGDMVPFWCREDQYSKEKSAIAKETASLLKPNDIVMIDGGTTTFYLADHLPQFPLRVITNSIRLAVAIDERWSSDPGPELFLTGGYIYPQSGVLIGPQATASFARYHADWAFMSVGGICSSGIHNTNEFVVENQLAMIERAERVIIMADHSKIGSMSMCRVCGLDRIHTLITDRHPSTVFALKQLESEGLRIITVEPGALSSRARIARAADK
ncbi:MAG: DeoR/GlpR family DNA-binding transcription regulator [Candidatus Hydrogenedentes bacterium]|nr:DeoR/GlpR family DNA-binding transcription regulator [Candidatus Hydrogenedentota bacterium]